MFAERIKKQELFGDEGFLQNSIAECQDWIKSREVQYPEDAEFDVKDLKDISLAFQYNDYWANAKKKFPSLIKFLVYLDRNNQILSKEERLQKGYFYQGPQEVGKMEIEKA